MAALGSEYTKKVDVYSTGGLGSAGELFEFVADGLAETW